MNLYRILPGMLPGIMLTVLLWLPATVATQETGEGAAEASSSIVLKSNRAYANAEDQVWMLSGGVSLKSAEFELKASEIRYDKKNGLANITGEPITVTVYPKGDSTSPITASANSIKFEEKLSILSLEKNVSYTVDGTSIRADKVIINVKTNEIDIVGDIFPITLFSPQPQRSKAK